MDTYYLRRRGIAAGARELEGALMRLRASQDLPGLPPAQWLHSYALREADGRFGLACLFSAESAEALREHALAVRLPAEEVLRASASPSASSFPVDAAPAWLVRRRGRPGHALLDEALDAARRLADSESPSRLTWQCSWSLQETDGSTGSCCLWLADGPRTLAEHADRAHLPCNEVCAVIGRIVFRAPAREQAADAAVPAVVG